MKESMINLFERARRVGVPIVTVGTADQAATIEVLRDLDDTRGLPMMQWDAARGITPLNDKGKDALAKAKVLPSDTIGFVEAMLAATMLPRASVLFAHNAHRQLQSQEPLATASAVQAVANLRDLFKMDFRMLVLMGPHVGVPSELEHDVVVLHHDLPEPPALEALVTELHASAKVKAPAKDVMVKAVDAVSGLSTFAAEQVASMALTDAGLDLDALWERKRVTIEQAKGLKVWRGGERFEDLVGLDAIKAHLRNRLNARTPIGCVVWLDEIDKALANVEHDTSGVRMDQLRTLLMEMENNEWRGLIGVGVAGAGKSAIAKAFGNEAGVPTIALDLGDMESKFVGDSEANLRQAMSIIKAVGRGNAYLIATSNAATVMRPELQRRFTDGLWMFDLMTAEERAATWAAYVKRYQLEKKQAASLPEDDGWTGAEIRNCVRYAWDTRCTLLEAARFIVPMARSRADEIEKLRSYAHGRFLDASKPGPYRYDAAPMERQLRAIKVDGKIN